VTGWNALVDRYVALWNEADDELRAKTVEDMYTTDAVYVMYARDPFVGHRAITRQITYAHRLYTPMGYTFKSSHNAVGHHNLVRFNWVMLSRETGGVEIVGLDVMVLDDSGRIRADYQFHEKLPSFSYDGLPTPEELLGP